LRGAPQNVSIAIPGLIEAFSQCLGEDIRALPSAPKLAGYPNLARQFWCREPPLVLVAD
jgi:hypothetical protein